MPTTAAATSLNIPGVQMTALTDSAGLAANRAALANIHSLYDSTDIITRRISVYAAEMMNALNVNLAYYATAPYPNDYYNIFVTKIYPWLQQYHPDLAAEYHSEAQAIIAARANYILTSAKAAQTKAIQEANKLVLTLAAALGLTSALPSAVTNLLQPTGLTTSPATTPTTSPGSSGTILPGVSNTNLLLIAGVAAVALLTAGEKKKSVSGVKAQDVAPWLVLGGVTFLAVGGIKKLLDAFGITAGAGTKAVQQASSDPNSPFNPAYWKNNTPAWNTGILPLDHDTAFGYAQTINDAFGLLQDDFDAILGVFHKLTSKMQVSYLADIYQQDYNGDLLNFLTTGGGVLPWDGLSQDHLKTITDYVNNLPVSS